MYDYDGLFTGIIFGLVYCFVDYLNLGVIFHLQVWLTTYTCVWVCYIGCYAGVGFVCVVCVDYCLLEVVACIDVWLLCI